MNSRTFNYLWLGQILANVGDIFLIIGLISLVYKQTSSPFFVALTSLIIIFSRIISNALSPLLNQFSLKKILLHAQTGKTILIGLFSISFFYLVEPTVHLVYVFAIVLSLLDSFILPAKNAYVPFLIKREELMAPNGYLSMTDQTLLIVSWAIGGVLYGLLSAKVFFLLLLVLYVISTFIKFKVPFIPTNSVVEKQVWFTQLGEGWREIKKNKNLKVIFTLNVFQTVSSVVWLAAILFLFVEKQLQLGSQWWGYINSSFFIGIMNGSLLLFKNQRFFIKYTEKWLIITTVLSVLIIFIFGWTTFGVMALLLSFLFGAVEQIKTIMLQTMLQYNTPPEKIGKVYAVHGLFTTILFGITIAIAGWLMEKTSVSALFLFAALVSMVLLLPLRFMNSKTAYPSLVR
ncbi:MFS transporter [Bacillus seohaeanensis]|uniref:MFS transporter n=1 Tax=Bacillus seohaeanensis TaxID=284580 RepID=A0ABW5RXC7_9BACI